MTLSVPLVQDYLIDSAARRSYKIALVCRDRRMTYGDLERGSDALAHTLALRGVARGDRVIVFGDNTIESVIAFWAILKANAVVVMVSPLTKEAKLSFYLEDCRATAMITDNSLASVFVPAAMEAKHLRVVIASGPALASEPNIPGLLPFTEAVATAAQPPARRNIDIDLAALIYTSGSTKEPKGVMLTHRNMMTAATSISTYLGSAEDDVVLGLLPLAFDYGLYQMIMSFRVGARLILERSFAFPLEVLRRMVIEGVTGFPGVPTVFAIMAELKTLADFDFSRVRYVTNTAAALPEKHIAMLRKTFPKAQIFSMYGLTECKRCTYLPPADLERKPGSVGIAIPDTELWVVDENGRRLPPNRVGQLVVRGATVMRGYWERPEETAKALRPGPLPGEMVLYTGDYCRIDDEGYVYFVGRMDDIVKSRGEKVSPKEVECALTDIVGVREAAVVGIADELLGNAIQAYVVLERGVTMSVKQIQIECHKRLEPFMVPKYVTFVADLDKTSSGKIKKTVPTESLSLPAPAMAAAQHRSARDSDRPSQPRVPGVPPTLWTGEHWLRQPPLLADGTAAREPESMPQSDTYVATGRSGRS